MSMPFYVSPEQMMEDRADYARKGIARGRALIALSFKNGILIVAENPSNTLHKVSEIYDRVAFAGVGKYNEFDQLRIAGVRHADLKGYSFSREDVDARNLANQYAQMLGQIFTREMKPMEVEILVAEISHKKDDIQPQMFHILYDGTVKDETEYAVLGGETEVILGRFSPLYKPNMTLSKAAQLAINSLSGSERDLVPSDLEVAELSIANGRRAFRRINGDELDGILS